MVLGDCSIVESWWLDGDGVGAHNWFRTAFDRAALRSHGIARYRDCLSGRLDPIQTYNSCALFYAVKPYFYRI